MITLCKKLCIKAVKANPLAQKIKEKQERSLRNCRSKCVCFMDFSERNSI